MYPNRMYPNNGMFIHNQAKYLAKAGCEVMIISPVPYAPRLLRFKSRWKKYGMVAGFDEIDGVPVHYPRYIHLPAQWYHGLSCFAMYIGINRLLNSMIKFYQPHLVHAHTATYDGYVGLMIKKKFNLPLVCSLRGSDINIYPHYEKLTMHLTRRVISGADRLISVSSALKNAAMGLENPAKEIQVVYNGCDFNDPHGSGEFRKMTRSKLGISSKDTVLIFAGSIDKDKGIFELINAFKKLKQKRADLHLILLGDGPETGDVKKILLSNDLGRRIHLTGSRPHKEMFLWLKAADLFVLPTYYEGLPNAILEAMACGLPVISTRVGGIPEAVIDGESGILINSKDEDALRSAIEFLLNSNGLAMEMGRNGRAIIERKFSWQRNAEETVRIYEDIINAKN